MTTPQPEYITEKLREFDGKWKNWFLKTGNFVIGGMIKSWLSTALQEVYAKGLEEGKAFNGKTKRKWYQRGYAEGKKDL